MATDVLIITTRDLPKIPIGNVTSVFEIINSENATEYFTKQEINIKNYLTGSDCGNGVKQEVQENLKAFCQQTYQTKLPMLKRTVNDSFLVYVTLCLVGSNLAGFGDEKSHNFLKAIITDVQADLKKNGTNDNYNLVILAHSMDLVADNGSNGFSRFVNKNEIKGFTIDIFSKINSIHIYTHEKNDTYYKNIVNVIANPYIDNNILNYLKQ